MHPKKKIITQFREEGEILAAAEAAKATEAGPVAEAEEAATGNGQSEVQYQSHLEQLEHEEKKILHSSYEPQDQPQSHPTDSGRRPSPGKVLL